MYRLQLLVLNQEKTIVIQVGDQLAQAVLGAAMSKVAGTMSIKIPSAVGTRRMWCIDLFVFPLLSQSWNWTPQPMQEHEL